MESREMDMDKYPILQKFVDVFLEELLGLSPKRVLDFSIEIVAGLKPISKVPYRMATMELMELKA